MTAAHVLANAKADVNSLRIFPSDGPRISLPFDGQDTLDNGVTDDEDYKDAAPVEIVLS